MTRRFHIVFNSNAGTALTLGLTAEKLHEQFVAAGLEVTIDADAETPFADRIAAALASEAEVIVAGGGDGTVTALAEAVVDTNKTLAVLPLGTANLLARDLGVPLDLALAIAGMPSMVESRIDVGEVWRATMSGELLERGRSGPPRAFQPVRRVLGSTPRYRHSSQVPLVGHQGF